MAAFRHDATLAHQVNPIAMNASPVPVTHLASWWMAGLLLLLGLYPLLGCNQVSEEEAHQRELIAGGKASYRAYCAGCHGVSAHGDGPAASAMTVAPADLTLISQRNGGAFPTEQVYDKVDGRTAPANSETLQMLHFGDIWRGTDPSGAREREVRQMIEEVVAYLETIQQ